MWKTEIKLKQSPALQLDKQLALILIKESYYMFFLKLLFCEEHAVIYKPLQKCPFNEMNRKLMLLGRKLLADSF